jgi:excisionase family DNA binding protein
MHAALDHSRAQKIVLVDASYHEEQCATLEVPPQALRLFADILGKMAQHQSITLVSQKALLTTQEAANLLNVSRPFIVKQLEAKKIDFIRVGRHRRIAFDKLIEYRDSMQHQSEDALQALADEAQRLDMGY